MQQLLELLMMEQDWSSEDMEMKELSSILQQNGIVGAGVEATIANVGRMARVGMKGTNEEIIKIMVGE